jgi:hypothetical protein
VCAAALVISCMCVQRCVCAEACAGCILPAVTQVHLFQLTTANNLQDICVEHDTVQTCGHVLASQYRVDTHGVCMQRDSCVCPQAISALARATCRPMSMHACGHRRRAWLCQPSHTAVTPHACEPRVVICPRPARQHAIVCRVLGERCSRIHPTLRAASRHLASPSCGRCV